MQNAIDSVIGVPLFKNQKTGTLNNIRWLGRGFCVCDYETAQIKLIKRLTDSQIHLLLSGGQHDNYRKCKINGRNYILSTSMIYLSWTRRINGARSWGLMDFLQRWNHLQLTHKNKVWIVTLFLVGPWCLSLMVMVGEWRGRFESAVSLADFHGTLTVGVFCSWGGEFRSEIL